MLRTWRLAYIDGESVEILKNVFFDKFHVLEATNGLLATFPPSEFWNRTQVVGCQIDDLLSGCLCGGRWYIFSNS